MYKCELTSPVRLPAPQLKTPFAHDKMGLDCFTEIPKRSGSSQTRSTSVGLGPAQSFPMAGPPLFLGYVPTFV